jgi:hypothetical protein
MKVNLRNNQFLVGSILHADELSITVVPAAANFGAHSNDVSPPAQSNIGCIATAGFLTDDSLDSDLLSFN